MFTRLMWGLAVTLSLGPALAEAQASGNEPSRPIALAVVASESAGANQEIQSSTTDIRSSIQRNYGKWFRLVSATEEADVVLEVTTRVVSLGLSKLQGRLTILDMYKGGGISAAIGPPKCSFDCWQMAADEIARKTQSTVGLYLNVFEARLATGQPTTAAAIPASAEAAPPPAAKPNAASEPNPASPPAPTSGPSADRDDDLGVDMAIVKVDSANMRGTPASNGEVVGKLPRGSMLVLITRDATEGWYNVVDARSGLDGWVHGPLVDLRLTSRTAGTPFQATQVDTTSPPKVEAHNESSYTLSLTVGTQKYTITPGTTLTLTIPAGSHRYIATAPGVIPAAGVKTWDTGHVYTWRFYVQ